MKKNLTLPALLLMALIPAIAQRPLKPNDLYRLKNISEPAISPEGNWVAYSISTVDSVKDKRSTDLWMSSWDGKDHIQLTHTPEGEGSPKFSPDGKYLSFLSSRGKLDHTQVWLMDRRGGEAKKVTGVAGSISGYEWSPDGKKILLVIRDLERADSLKEKPRNPLVIDRVHFKQDYEGYKLPLYRHLYLFDLATSKLDTLTKGAYDNHSPAFRPDGQRIVFGSNRTADPDRNGNTDLWIIDAKPSATVRKLTDWAGSDSQPKWSPDGTSIAYLRSTGTGNFLMYEQSVLCTIKPDGGQPVLHTAGLDRDAHGHRWSKDGKTIGFLVSDDRYEYAATVAAGGGPVTTLDRGHYEYSM
ncbi:MAG: TolB family protein, partial [Bacteroidota bacterium]